MTTATATATACTCELASYTITGIAVILTVDNDCPQHGLPLPAAPTAAYTAGQQDGNAGRGYGTTLMPRTADGLVTDADMN